MPERKFEVTYTIEPIDLTLLAQTLTKQFLKEQSEKGQKAEEKKKQIAT